MTVQPLPELQGFLPGALYGSLRAGVMAGIANLDLPTRSEEFRNIGFERLGRINLHEEIPGIWLGTA